MTGTDIFGHRTRPRCHWDSKINKKL